MYPINPHNEQNSSLLAIKSDPKSKVVLVLVAVVVVAEVL
jgi:hypothetical protein